MLTLVLNTNPSSPFRRLIAALGVALVLFLGTAAASPVVHDHLHGDDAHATTAPHTCAVVLFASGITLATIAIAVRAPRIVWRACPATRVTKIFLTAPRYLRQPERGPPAS